MLKQHVRTVQGQESQLIPSSDAMAEINSAMMERKSEVRTMSASRDSASITYKSGERVSLRPASEKDLPKEPVAVYARTFSATRRHIINPAHRTKTLCGHNVMLAEKWVQADGSVGVASRESVLDLTPCGRCEKSANAGNISR